MKKENLCISAVFLGRSISGRVCLEAETQCPWTVWKVLVHFQVYVHLSVKTFGLGCPNDPSDLASTLSPVESIFQLAARMIFQEHRSEDVTPFNGFQHSKNTNFCHHLLIQKAPHTLCGSAHQSLVVYTHVQPSNRPTISHLTAAMSADSSPLSTRQAFHPS